MNQQKKRITYFPFQERNVVVSVANFHNLKKIKDEEMKGLWKRFVKNKFKIRSAW